MFRKFLKLEGLVRTLKTVKFCNLFFGNTKNKGNLNKQKITLPSLVCGMTLVEVLVGTAVFIIVSVSVYGAYVTILNVVDASRVKIAAVDLANEQFEIVRNLPYSDIGIENSIPDGILERNQTINRNGFTFNITTTVRNVDLEFDGTVGGDPNDLSPADNKLVEIELTCSDCKNFTDSLVFSTRVAPKNLEAASDNGSLFVHVIDSNGLPIQGVDIHLENNQENPAIVIDDVTNNDGVLQVVDAPPGVVAYEIDVSKSNFSSVTTYATDDLLPSEPVDQHATVSLQQLTERTFIIDELSDLDVSSVSNTCSSIGSVDFSMTGSKKIGINPDLFKYNTNHITNGSGELSLSNLEWDTYELSVFDGTYELAGSEPLLPLNVSPGTSQDLLLTVVPRDPSSLLVLVRDSSTDLPVSDAEVILEKSGDYTLSETTGRGSLTQSDWSGGAGQLEFTNETKFHSSDGNVEVSSPAGDVKLLKVFDDYQTDGYLISSIFDTGSDSNFHQLIWDPSDQPPQTGADSVRLQIATAVSTTSPWVYLGPDGTETSYYTNPVSSIHSSHNSDRYFRYKLLLHTDDISYTPNVSNVSFTYTSNCIPPGQVLFNDLNTGGHDLTINRTGYQQFTGLVDVVSDWQSYDADLLPE